MSRKIGRTKDNELIKVYSAAEKYVVDIDSVTIGQFDTPGKAEEVAKVEMLRSYGLDYEQAREIVNSNIIISYNFLSDWKEKTDQKVEVVQKGKKWITKINGAYRGEADTKEDAERTADFILVSKQHPKWTVQQCWDYVDQERGS
ncbi:MAG: hypothetical protein BHK79_07795 [Halanaerobium sp. MDAL1]|nr:MAG: hypothetical protein BHK79_07795 [Halanaerobium sp. MDAL1]